jgi:hypothetical protein
LNLLAADGTPLMQVTSQDLAGRLTNLAFPAATDGWYVLDAALDLESGGPSGVFQLTLAQTTTQADSLYPSGIPPTGTGITRLNSLITLTPSPTSTPTPVPSETFTATQTFTPTNTLPPSLTPSETWTFTPSPTNRPTDIPTATDTPVPTDTPTPIHCPGALPSQLQVGKQARVNEGIPNRLRDAPGKTGVFLTNLDGGTILDVLDGPVCKDGYAWWKVRAYGTQVGWTVESGNGQYWIVPY